MCIVKQSKIICIVLKIVLLQAVAQELFYGWGRGGHLTFASVVLDGKKLRVSLNLVFSPVLGHLFLPFDIFTDKTKRKYQVTLFSVRVGEVVLPHAPKVLGASCPHCPSPSSVPVPYVVCMRVESNDYARWFLLFGQYASVCLVSAK